MLPERPAGTEGWDAARSPALVTRDAMVGVARARPRMNGVHDMGGMQDMGAIHDQKDEPVFHAAWEGRVFGLNRALGAWRLWNIDASATSAS